MTTRCTEVGKGHAGLIRSKVYDWLQRAISCTNETTLEERMSDNNTLTPWLITVEEAVKLLCISRTKLYQMVARGEVPYVRFSADTGALDRGTIRFNPRSLQAWLQQLEESKKPKTGL